MSTFYCPKDCPKRQVGCHSGCPDYNKLVEMNRQRNEARRKENEIRVAVSNVQYHGLKKSKKEKNL